MFQDVPYSSTRLDLKKDTIDPKIYDLLFIKISQYSSALKKIALIPSVWVSMRGILILESFPFPIFLFSIISTIRAAYHNYTIKQNQLKEIPYLHVLPQPDILDDKVLPT